LEKLLTKEYPQYLDIADDIRKLHRSYELYKRENNLMDYDDLLINFASLLTNVKVRSAIADKCKYIMVDEYQDTNKAQAEIVKHLASKHNNVMVVGDDAQTIYTFRGSTIENIEKFAEELPGCTIVKLEENFRSTQPILNLTNEILKRSPFIRNI
jgi:DNA helicase-2/ATP-dependent DNA helicase PcrA